MRRRLSILSIVACCCVGPAVGHAAPPKAQLNVREVCSSRLLTGDGVVLTTNLTITNARPGRVTVRVLAGWNVGGLYLKARDEVVVRLGPGGSARRSVTLRLASAPELAKSLRARKRLGCASTKTYTLS